VALVKEKALNFTVYKADSKNITAFKTWWHKHYKKPHFYSEMLR